MSPPSIARKWICCLLEVDTFYHKTDFQPLLAEMTITRIVNTCALLDSCSKETINGCVRRTADGLVIGLTVNRYVKTGHRVYVVQT